MARLSLASVPLRPAHVGLGVIAALVLVVIAGSGPVVSGATQPSPAPSSTPRPTLVAVATPSPSPTPTPIPTPLPTPTPPPTDLPIVGTGDCAPAEVPGAATFTPPANLVVPRDFALKVPVLMYHRIAPYTVAAGSLPGLVVPPEIFDAQLAGLVAAGWHTITLAQVARDLDYGITPVAKTFVITIDDGWDDGFTYALPILQKYNLVATYFVITSRIDAGGFLSAKQLRTLVAAGNEIGNHTVDHLDMPSLNDAELKSEIAGASVKIASVTGVWPTTLAYPSGSNNERTQEAVAACGLKMAVTTKGGVLETQALRFQVPRLRVGPDTQDWSLLVNFTR